MRSRILIRTYSRCGGGLGLKSRAISSSRNEMRWFKWRTSHHITTIRLLCIPSAPCHQDGAGPNGLSPYTEWTSTRVVHIVSIAPYTIDYLIVMQQILGEINSIIFQEFQNKDLVIWYQCGAKVHYLNHPSGYCGYQQGFMQINDSGRPLALWMTMTADPHREGGLI